MRSAPARSAIVRATRAMRSNARALSAPRMHGTFDQTEGVGVERARAPHGELAGIAAFVVTPLSRSRFA